MFLRISMDTIIRLIKSIRKITVDMTRRELISNSSQITNTINISKEVIGILIYHPNHLLLHTVHSFRLQFQKLRYKISGIEQDAVKMAPLISHQKARNLINFLNLMILRLVKIDLEILALFITLTFFEW